MTKGATAANLPLKVIPHERNKSVSVSRSAFESYLGTKERRRAR